MEQDLQKLYEAITERGYVSLKASPSITVAQAMEEVASRMGGIVLTGRGGKVLETLKTLEADEAPPRSLSRLSGAGIQPWHVDGSHLTVPPRYVILGCQIVTGAGSAPTQLMRIKDAGFTLPESYREPFIVRNGRSSFYSMIASRDRSWIRFDPGCMSAQTAKGRSMLAELGSFQIQPCLSLDWTVGAILVIDNWAVLHRRGKASGPGNRTLLRISMRD